MLPFIILGLMLAVITYLLIKLLGKGSNLMATVAEISAKLDDIQTGVDALEKEISDLKAKVASGGVASQADLDSLMTKVSAVSDDLKDTSDQA